MSEAEKMSEAAKIRAEIDNNTVKGLFAANSGGAIALLSLLPIVLGKEQYGNFSNYVVVGLVAMQIGIVLAVIHNHMRRVCSADFSSKAPKLKALQDKGKFWKLLIPETCLPCFYSHWARRFSLACFLLAGFVVAFGAWTTSPSEMKTKVHDNTLSEQAPFND